MNAREAKHQPKDRDLELAREYARRLRERLGNNLVTVTLYGSRARGDAREGSDFDLIVRVRERTEEVRETITDVDVGMMNEFEELFVGIPYDEGEWSREAKFPFGWNVAREGVSV
jgi:uncharacterized protein